MRNLLFLNVGTVEDRVYQLSEFAPRAAGLWLLYKPGLY